jgi:DNA-binding MarR family transcriptional regulator
MVIFTAAGKTRGLSGGNPGHYNGYETKSAYPDPMTVSIRPAQSLELWHRVALALVHAEEDDLSARQMAILLTIYLEAPPHTVRGLATRLEVTKPVITRALDTMGAMGLVNRRRDEADRRNVVIQRTVKGALYLERLGDLITATAAELPR